MRVIRQHIACSHLLTRLAQQILRILKSEGLAPSIPEDLYHLIKKAVSVRKHLERNRKDMDSKVSSKRAQQSRCVQRQ